MAQDKNIRLGRESKAYTQLHALGARLVRAQSSGDRCVLQQVRLAKRRD